jgi:uncharacterized protein
MGDGDMKRKYGTRPGWKRILEREFAQSFLNTEKYKGYITLIKAKKVSEPLLISYESTEMCILNDGYLWLQHFPLEKNFSVTTMFNHHGEIVQWYIDICHQNSVENGIPWMDDLYLDLIVLPSGEIIEKDAEELEGALSEGMIDKDLYDLAWTEQRRLKNLISQRKLELLKLSTIHKDILVEKLK